MKTKRLLLSLLAGAFLCFSNASYAQYHHSGSSGGSGDGAFGQGTNNVDLGVGFGSGFGSLYAGTSASVSPAYELSYEHGFSDHWGIGLSISDQSATSTYSYESINLNTFLPESFTYTYKSSLLVINLTGAYHFTVNANLDPYIGVQLGYASVSTSFSSNDPSTTGISSSSSYSGVDYGVFGGARYFFTSHIGVWAELRFSNASFSVGSYNGVSSSVSINSSCIGNVGLAIKF